jgi:hypothetical protein
MKNAIKRVRRKLLDKGLSNYIDFDMYCYLLDRVSRRNNIVKFKFSDFYKDIKKDCLEYSLSERSVYRVFHRIAKIGIINIQVMGFGEALIEVKLLHELFCDEGQEMTDPSNVVVDENEDSEGDTEVKPPQTGIDQQQLIYADQKCRAAGINFQKKDLWKIAKYPKELIHLAINCFKSSDLAESTHIRNPAGWLISCLEKKYYSSYRPEKIAKSMEQKLFEIEEWFLDNLGTLPSRMERPSQFQKN